MTAPDRLARNYVHQMLLVDELTQRGCRVEFVERPMSDDPHDQLLLQIRSAVAEYERTLIAERMRRGRQAKLRSGQLLPWTRAPYGSLLDPDRPRDASRCVWTQSRLPWWSKCLPGIPTPARPQACIRWRSASAMPTFPHLGAEHVGMSLRYGVFCAPLPTRALPIVAGPAPRRPAGVNPLCSPWGLARVSSPPSGGVDCRAGTGHYQ